MNNQSSNQRIAKNTVFLYFRMILLLGISLYTSRAVLAALGVDDYGVYNVVGGFVSMFSMVSAALYNASTRFITFALGEGDEQHVNDVFCTSLSLHILLALGLCLIIEPVGIWFVSQKMTIDPTRISAALWVLQFSILTFALNIIMVPYNACIIAHEKFKAFAYIGIFDALLKLFIVYLLYVSMFDKLIVYAFLMFVESIMIRFVYSVYCKKNFKECRYKVKIHKPIFRKMASFSGWNLLGSSSFILRDQGVNILINLYCGPAVNAARAVAHHAMAGVNQFANGFLTAMNPQIIKDYAAGQREHMHFLVNAGAKLSAFMIVLMAVPLISTADFVMGVWLVEVPEHAVLFLQLLLVFLLFNSMSSSLTTGIDATGNNKRLQVYSAFVSLLNLPLSLIILLVGFPPEFTVVIAILLAIITLFIKAFLSHKQYDLPFWGYIYNVFVKVSLIFAITVSFGLFLEHRMGEGWGAFIVEVIIIIIVSTLVIYILGLNRREKLFVKTKSISIVKKIIKNR